LRRRAAIEPRIDHLKSDHRLGRNFLKGQQGDAINLLLATAASNLSLWMRHTFSALLSALRAWWLHTIEPSHTELARVFSGTTTYRCPVHGGQLCRFFDVVCLALHAVPSN
jgi:hypothetical protein